MDYNELYKNRSSAKKHSTKIYSQEQFDEIINLIKKYYEIEFPQETINTNPAYFIPLSDAINDIYFKSREVIKAKYLSEIYNGIGLSKKKSIEKMNSIKEFLCNWLGLHQSNNQEQLTEGANGIISDWLATTNNSTPQWAAYVALPLKNKMLKRITFDVFTKTKYYRIGLKFLRVDGKLFGDGSIQSQDNNFVIHVGKNFMDKDLFITTYRNGILERPDKYTNIIPVSNQYKCELFIDAESFLHFFINSEEVYKNLVNKEILSRAYLLAWGDGNKYEVKVKNIKLEIASA